MAMKWAVLASGMGTITESMLGDGLRPDVMLADRPGSRAIEVVGRPAGLPVIVVDRTDYGYQGFQAGWRRDDFTAEVTRRLQQLGIDVIAMDGFDTVLSPIIFETFKGRVLNTHPSLLPAFEGLYGAKVIQATLDSGIKTTGCTVHLATEVVDDGHYILGQRTAPVLPGDTVEMLWERIKIEERKLYAQVMRDLLGGKLELPELI